MFKEITSGKQVEKLGDIIDMLAAIAVTMREAFVHQQSRFLDDGDKLYLDLNEEIAFEAAMVDERMIGKTLDEREPLFRYENILTHLQRVDKSLRRVADALRYQMKQGVLLFDKETDRIVMLLECQENILRTLSGVVRNGDGERLKEVADECRELAGACLKFATICESRMVDGLCTPESAPVLITILDRLQTVARNEAETLKLLAGWIWNRISAGAEEQRIGHLAY